MPKARKTKVQSVKETQEVSNEVVSNEVVSNEVSIEKTGPMTKEEWCKANDITRPGSNYAETEYAKYLASGN